MEQVILVDDQDNEVGVMGKLQAHIDGRLHRALSVFIFNSKGELLLQQRAEGKYHSAGLWTNACCSHPRPGETVSGAAERRLQEEMGLRCPIKKAFSFVYSARFANGLTEHEFDHVFIGNTDDVPMPDGAEVAAWKYMSPAETEQDINDHPYLYTEWFKICLRQWKDKLFTTA